MAPCPLYGPLPETASARRGARGGAAAAPGRGPCRVSLRDADAGEALVLVNHAHLTDPTSPYRASGPIFVRESAVEQAPITGPAPEMLTKRPLSLRLYDHRNMMIEGLVIDGADLDARLAEAFDHPALDQIHIHFAPRGCYLARACRIEAPLP
ncbi:DUF1203 domain-containing protein [Brevundimonas sp.]|uniref:DUF1203 domain-containing protein n=1 Tax=Brevundimonas sp. TaxID=1871086 RepID=UPI0025B9D55B|nr:DUF1203 domain-containing protein [Brevundimonas sp.]MCG2664190.1 DUF1203 domain-containing protein [Brevundimonas sp.]